jgi:glycosyltransferase involved in cell wall biosynthesis
MLDHVTPVILTLDEAPNIGRVLRRLAWAKDVVVVDSCSEDETAPIVATFANARLIQRKFDGHAAQWNHAIGESGIRTEWILALDADYVVPDELVHEIGSLAPGPDVAGYRVGFKYLIEGRMLRATVYPPVVALYRAARARYVQDGHTQRVAVDGTILDLRNCIYHDDRKPLRRWLRAQAGYMQLEARKLAARAASERTAKDRLRRMIVIAPVAMFCYCMFVKGNVLDGRAGLFYSLQRSIAEALLSLYLLQSLLEKDPPPE